MTIEREFRTFSVTAELREDGNALTLNGYASTFDQPYKVGPFSETVRSTAFNKTIAERDDVRLLVNHEGIPLARTKSGTLRLSPDATGLNVSADLEPRMGLVNDVRLAMERGDLDQMSFGFKALRDSWDKTRSNRELHEVKLYDVSVVTYPANPHATVGLRADMVATEMRGLMVAEWRAGKALSQANVDKLCAVLDQLSVADGALDPFRSVIDGVDNALDAAQAIIADALGVQNPDPDDDAEANVARAAAHAAVRRDMDRLTLRIRHA